MLRVERDATGHRAVMSIRRTVTAVLAAASLTAALAPSATARTDEPLGGAVRDEVGDVEVTTSRDLSRTDLDRVDLTRVSWTVSPGRRVTFRMRLVDVARGPFRTSYGVTARAGISTLFVMATPRGGVVVIDGERVQRCRDARSSIDERRDVVRFSTPVRCLPADRYRFRPLALLETRGGEDLAIDQAAGTGALSVR